MVRDVLPPLLRVAALPAGCTARGAVLTCVIALLHVGQTWGIRFIAAVSDDAVEGARIRNCTAVSSSATVLSSAVTVISAATVLSATASARQDPVGSCTSALVQEPFLPVTGLLRHAIVTELQLAS
jgi:hypothetical protein